MSLHNALLLIPYPNFDPVAIAIGPFSVRWYALAYISALLIGWRYCIWLSKRRPRIATTLDIDDFLVWATFGIILGGRIGYVLFYKPGYYIDHLLEIPELWHGGMSFHGGCLGVTIALVLFTRRRGIPLLGLADLVACSVPIGLFFGRLANFINGELYGRPTDVAWAMIFPNDPLLVPRHPSQLYQASMEGLILFAIVTLLNVSGARMRGGIITGTFLIGYAIARSIGELFRQPDQQLGFLIFGTTMGQLLSIPMVVGGIWLIVKAKPIAENAPAIADSSVADPGRPV